jgi:hypothetical protein
LKIVNIQSTIQVIFGVLDDDGDVTFRQPVNFEIGKLNEDSWKEVLAKMVEAKAQLEKQYPAKD